MKLGGLAANTGFAAAELEAMTIDQVLFWWGAVGAWQQASRDA
ncbi:hypothetical protein PQJ75_13790 [Rhodoplanes sp. TEM]|uniref:Uncharacterized protein n=1 Tax=Rhodoplanes tepidamans TaxID=200616 RepID=A0ABT5JE78_RHOTP|nr:MULTISPECIES: hypothetical protein [Rhodoplanes]MDC7787963.1 hypothetical protein [Rhodoplanes tepidamans]MDC7984803.1 hypothetical protein [Rhodoplanes sp. TEM]